MRVEEAKEQLAAILPSLKDVAKEEKFEYDFADSEQRFEEQEIRRIADHLYSLIYSIEYLQKPIRFSGRIMKRPDRCYEIEQSGECFTSSSPIEVWNESEGMYERTRVEFDGTDYFAVGVKQPLDGLQARCR